MVGKELLTLSNNLYALNVAGSNLKGIDKIGKKGYKPKLIEKGVDNIVGTSLFKVNSQLIGDL